MNEINRIKKDQSLIHATKTSSILESLRLILQESGEDQERRHSVVPILLAFGEITHFEGGGGRLPNKGRYGCAASSKPRPGTISPKNLMPGQKKCPKT